MGRKCFLLGLAALTVFGAGLAHSRECRGISFPDQIQSGGSRLTLNGLGLHQATVFKLNVYVAALYVVTTSTDANAILGTPAPYELVLQFVRDVDGSDIDKDCVEGFRRNSHAQLPALQERIATLTQWITDIKSGERLQFSFKPGAGLQVTVNGAIRGTISGDDFGKAFLSIWLGLPPNPGVKAGMLGGPCS